MASGDRLITLTPHSADLPTSGNVPSPDTHNDQPHLAFDAAVDGIVNFPISMPPYYDGGGTTITVIWRADTATTAESRFSTAFERHQDGVTDTGSDGFATANTVDATAPGTAGIKAYDTIAHTDGAEMDSIAAGEVGRLQLQRVGTHANDDMAGDAQWCEILIDET